MLSFETLGVARPGSCTATGAAPTTSSPNTLRCPAVIALLCHLIAGKHAENQHMCNCAGSSAAPRTPGSMCRGAAGKGLWRCSRCVLLLRICTQQHDLWCCAEPSRRRLSPYQNSAGDAFQPAAGPSLLMSTMAVVMMLLAALWHKSTIALDL